MEKSKDYQLEFFVIHVCSKIIYVHIAEALTTLLHGLWHVTHIKKFSILILQIHV